eukprot:TRINITY_DN34135_c0_g1_i1.p1 TRINITY_DN34135_c0_g1~~TRINITY_DN34135_c0_g1_i1.p1  ORF type:complete len:2270 (+),score=350.43 TRINITY_DN34135_c0_g1_i1:69-6878(+)
MAPESAATVAARSDAWRTSRLADAASLHRPGCIVGAFVFASLLVPGRPQSSGNDPSVLQCPEVEPFVLRGAMAVPPRCGVSCTPIQLEGTAACMYDISDCAGGVEPGATCTVGCKAPHVGNTSLANCPGNINIAQEPFWEPPYCKLPLELCTPPGEDDELPAGFVRLPGGGWSCAEGYAGDAQAHCDAGEGCKPTFSLAGCLPLKPCGMPEVDACKLQMVNCKDIWPGDSCVVSCKFPYVALPSVAICYPGNTDPTRGLLLVEPECELTCPPPKIVPKGYTKNSTGHWVCDEGWGGDVLAQCRIREDCSSWLELSGCSPEEPCQIPYHDRCRYTFEECSEVMPNKTCPVKCATPYVGNASSAKCPEGNTDPTTLLQWTAPKCEMDCRPLESVPEGYVTYPYVKTFEGWECAPGYSGEISVGCSTAPDCSQQLELTGCRNIISCAQPVLAIEERCTFDILDCLFLGSGKTCEVFCRWPYIGDPVEAKCPMWNTNPLQRPVYEQPACRILDCPEPPEGIPAGYRKRDDVPEGEPVVWECDDNYYGQAVSECVFNWECDSHLDLSGCAPLTPCIMVANDDCVADWTICADGVYSGKQCEIPCQEPYFGTSGYGTCVPDNTDPLQAMDYVLPSCDINCTEQVANNTLEEGYVWPEWDCDEEAIHFPLVGVNVSCVAEQLMVQSIALPHECKEWCMNMPECHAYKTQITEFSENGTACDECVLYGGHDCSQPYQVPIDCNGTAHLFQKKSVAYAGDAVRTFCDIQEESCEPYTAFEGCKPIVPCAAPRLEPHEVCAYDTSNCQGGVAPGASCNVTCLHPQEGGTTEAYCPSDNVDPNKPVLWVRPWCELPRQTCLDHSPEVSEGYSRINENCWRCAPGYGGVVQQACFSNLTSNCTPTLTLKGCLPLQNCATPQPRNDEEKCSTDFTPCENIAPGEKCTLRCKAPYVNVRETNNTCPATNVDASKEPDWSPPTCSLTCEDPIPLPLGYAVNGSGWEDYMCATGYSGSFYANCTVKNELQTVTIKGFPRNLGGSNYRHLNGVYVSRGQPAYFVSGKDTYWKRDQPLDTGLGEYYIYWCAPERTWSIAALDAWDTNKFGEQCDSLAYTEKDVDILDPSHVRIKAIWTGYVWNEYLNNTGVTALDLQNCTPIVTFDGCKKIIPCKIPPDADACKLDLAKCGDGTQVQPGESCNVKCKPPYLQKYGTLPVYADCDAVNTNEYGIQWNEPNCVIGCSAATDQVGYARRRATPFSGFVCDHGYVGETVRQMCFTNEDCIVRPVLYGCSPLQACAPPVLTPEEKCMYDVTDCQAVMSEPVYNTFCSARCKSPFNGSAATSACLGGNLNASTPLVWTSPLCRCPMPVIWPTGYKLVQVHYYPGYAWECAEGYSGQATWVCAINTDTCYAMTEISGCFAEVKCHMPELNGSLACEFNASQCEAGVRPGHSCLLGCTWPYEGNGSLATCPLGNFAPLPVSFDRTCELNCSDPVVVPVGYRRGRWRCSRTHRGSITYTCGIARNTSDQLGENCSADSQLSGCFPLQPCLPPAVNYTEECDYDVSNCTGVMPGETCTIKCARGTVGKSTQALCPPDNIDPEREMIYNLPKCDMRCGLPEVVPPGYEYTYDCGWQCKADYTGLAVLTCVADEEQYIFRKAAGYKYPCRPKATLSGCFKREICTLPPTDNYDVCKYDISNCSTRIMQPGDSCDVKCLPPWTSPNVTKAICPFNNIERLMEISWHEPENPCFFPCPEPFELPVGYARVGYMDWICAENYTGTPVATCTANRTQGCEKSFVFTGCHKLLPCRAPEVSDPCKYDASDCAHVPYGKTCKMRCRSPAYAGAPSIGRCPEDNIDDTTPVPMEEPTCELDCQEPIFPEPAYYHNESLHWTEWECSELAMGTPEATCDLSKDCFSALYARTMLTGCTLLQKCIVTVGNVCRMDIPDCDPLAPGDLCIGKCKDEFLGIDFNGTCPSNNTDPTYPVEWTTEPSCRCRDPDPIPEGYALSEHTHRHDMPDISMRWLCAENWTGTVRAECLCDGRLVLTGCDRIVPCAPPPLEYMANRTHCQSVAADTSCIAECLEIPCIMPGQLKFSCPDLNIDPNRPPALMEGNCMVRCETCMTSALIDTNVAEGILSGELKFGPVHAQQSVSIPEVQGFRLVFLDDCGTDMGEAHGFIPKVDYDPGCCRGDTYTVELTDMQIPRASGGNLVETIMIRIVTEYGELPIGTKVYFKDRVGVAESTKALTSASRRLCGRAAWLPLLLLLAFAAEACNLHKARLGFTRQRL